ncbi:transporter substrate-binding domain-containing protein [Zoogloea sp.]|uniref:transporter substrate-binding domain-containing protein n=1 Tax=Zoogloea sp. TaxID=49181 RepID=UPI0035B43FF3
MFDQCMKKFLTGVGGGIALLALLAVPAAAQVPSSAAVSVQAPPGKVKLPPARSVLDQVRRAGVLRVGVVEQIPWTFTNRSGQLAGFEVDVARALASDLGVRLELVRASANGIADDVAGGHADIGAAGLWFSPQRALVVNYTRPYSEATMRLFASRAKAAGRTDLAAYRLADVTLGVLKGSPGAAFAPKAFPLARISTFERYADLADAVETGSIDAGISMSPRPEFLVHVGGDRIFLPVGNAIATRSESFIVPRGDADILAYLDSWIRYRDETGWLRSRRDYWFGSFAWADQLEAK